MSPTSHSFILNYPVLSLLCIEEIFLSPPSALGSLVKDPFIIHRRLFPSSSTVTHCLCDSTAVFLLLFIMLRNQEYQTYSFPKCF